MRRNFARRFWDQDRLVWRCLATAVALLDRGSRLSFGGLSAYRVPLEVAICHANPGAWIGRLLACSAVVPGLGSALRKLLTVGFRSLHSQLSWSDGELAYLGIFGSANLDLSRNWGSRYKPVMSR